MFLPHEITNIEVDSPSEVVIKPRLKHDVQALKQMLKGEKPPLRRVSRKAMSHVYYGFGNASGSVFGATLNESGKLHYEYGQWCDLESEEISNWGELRNLCNALEGWVQEHNLAGSQLFIFTNNSTAEEAFWKITSKSRKLCDLILQMKWIAMNFNIDLHIIHLE